LARYIKKYNDMHIYLDGVAYLKYCKEIIRQISKDDKVCFGNELLIEINNFLVLFRRVYEESDVVIKEKLMKDMQMLLKNNEVRINIMKDCKILSVGAVANTLQMIGLLEKQIGGWLNRVGLSEE